MNPALRDAVNRRAPSGKGIGPVGRKLVDALSQRQKQRNRCAETRPDTGRPDAIRRKAGGTRRPRRREEDEQRMKFSAPLNELGTRRIFSRPRFSFCPPAQPRGRPGIHCRRWPEEKLGVEERGWAKSDEQSRHFARFIYCERRILDARKSAAVFAPSFIVYS